MYNIEESISNHEQSTNNDGGVLVGNSNMNIQVSSAMDAGDLLSAVVSQSAIDTHNVVIDGTVGTMAMDNLQMLQPMTDFSSLVGMEDIQISGDEILVQSDGNLPEHQTMLVHHPNVVGNNIEISSNQQTSPILIQQNHQPQLQHQQQSYPSSMVEVSSANILTETIPAINSNLLTTTIEPASPEPSQQLLQQQQQMNISLSSDVAMGDDMSELTIHEVHQSSSKSIPQTQGTLLPTIVTPNTAHIIAAAAAAQQPTNTPTTSSSAQTKTQVMNFPKLTLATTTQSQVQMAPIKITTTGTSVQQQQQPIFVTNQFLGSGMSGLQAGNISYILPPNTNFGKQTIAMKPGSGPNLASLGNATFVINQMPTGSKSGASSSAPTANLKLVQTSQGQQLILAAPFKPLTSTSSMGSLGSPKGSNQPISVKSAPTAQKGIPTIQFPAGSQAQLIGTSQNAAGQQQQQLIILSPVKQSPVVQSKQSTFAMPAMKLFSQGPSTSGSGSVISSKLQQIAPAPSKSQRVLAPAPTPILANKSAISITSGTTKPIQTLVHSNAKNVQYISFVPVSGAMSTSVSSNPIQNQTQAKLISSVAGGSTATKFFPLKPNSTGLSKPMIGTAGNSNATLKPNMVHLTTTGLGIGAGGTQKVLINPNTIKISTTVPSGTNMLTSGALASKISTGALNNSGKPTSIWMLPKQHVIKVESGSLGPTSLSGSTFQIQTTKPLPTACTPASKFVPIAPNPHQSSLNAAAGSGALQEHKMMATNTLAKLPPTISSDSFAEEARRKPCNCTRSQCLKLYCDCFANGEFCNNCNCVSCCNNLMHEEIRQKAIRLCLDRNPNAFHPKIGQNTHHGDGERKHTKGCCCKRSGCLKNYCECYEAKILCSDKCKCVGCKNFEESTERKTLMHLADAAEFRSVQQAYTSKVQIWGPDLKLKLPVKVKSDCHPFNIFTMDILEATACCMLAQAEEGEYENYSEENVESLILDQFGECFSQILNMASNNGMQDEIESDDEEQPNSSSQQNSSQQSTTDDQYHHNNELFERT